MANIFLHDEFDPEATAMLQALYSRSAKSVEDHIQGKTPEALQAAMKKYYVGYGHDSIGDCGTTTLFIEGVSMLAAKAIQDNPLYSGQETSSRYIDFSAQEILNPIGSVQGETIQEKWRKFYVDAQESLVEFLQAKFPRKPDQKETIWEKAIKARSFDILRGFLITGVTTQLSWATNLRQAHDKLLLLRFHPLEEMRNLAEGMLVQLKAKYPNSFGHPTDTDRENYLQQFAREIHYLRPAESTKTESSKDETPEFSYETSVQNDVLEREVLDLIQNRPPRTNLPRFFSKYGRYQCAFLLDYGSFRDIQRHRNGLCPLPILGEQHGFHQWYLAQLSETLQQQAKTLIAEQMSAIRTLDCDNLTAQYYMPLGNRVRCEVAYDLPEMIYVAELRSGSTVHPTLRKVAHQMVGALQKEHPNLALHVDMSEDPWDIRRGEQDIEKRS